MHDAIVFFTKSQCTIVAKIAIRFDLADLALYSKGVHKKDDVFYLVEHC